MKIKYELAQDVIIYILSLVLLVLVIWGFNQKYFSDYLELKSQMNLINSGVNIVDAYGQNINQQIITNYNASITNYNFIRNIEISFFIIVGILGFILVIHSITTKINLIETTLVEGVSKLENLQPLKVNNKYIEIEKISTELNNAIMSIRSKDTMRKELYENMVHDFVTPLHILSGNLELLNAGIDIDINILNEQVKRLEHLTKLNIHNQKYDSGVFNSDDLKQYINILEPVYPQVTISTVIKPNIQFLAKSESMYRVIDNIVKNATEHGKASEIVVKLEENDNKCYLSIENNGLQIDNKIIDQLFNRNVSTSSSGLGLGIVKDLLDDMDMLIDVTSTLSRTSILIII